MERSHVIVLLMTAAAAPLTAGADGLNCSGTSRFGKSLQHVEPPPACQRSPTDGGAAWCDTPGTDYPWQEIREYLRRSSEEVSKRAGHVDPSDIQRLLMKYGLAKTRIASRRSRSADVAGARDVTGQQLVREAGRVTSRSGGWQFSGQRSGETGATSVTEMTNFELLSAQEDGSRSDDNTSPSERINDKDLSQEEELAVLFSYFTNPTNVVFTEGVLEGILRLGESFGNALEQVEGAAAPASEETGSSAEETHPQNKQPDDGTWSESNSNAPQLANTLSPSDETEVVQTSVLNNTSNTENDSGQTPKATAGATGNTSTISDISQITHQENPGQIPSATPAESSPPSPPPPVMSPSADPDTSSDPLSTTPTTPPPPRFPDAHSRHPAPSVPGGAIPARTRPAEEAPTGTRTGADVLAEIRTGDDILADITGGDETPAVAHHTGSSQSQQWTWRDPQPGDWTRRDPDRWADESVPAEVQYYLPPAAPSGGPAAADAFEWVDSPAPQWRPLPPQEEPLVAQPLEPTGSPEREVLDHGQHVATTRPPATVQNTAADLVLREETVYTNPIYRPGEEGEVSQPATTTAMRTSTTARPPTVATTTSDPYVISACQASVEIRSPFYAMNTQNIWKMLINIPPFETYIHMEHCVEEHVQGGCAAGCRCTQRHTVRTMPVYERDANGCDQIYMDKFLFPSHCDCMCLPLHHVLFNLTRPAATTAASIVAIHNSTLPPPPPVGGGSSGTAPPSGQRANSTLPERVTDGVSIEALKAAGLSAARVVTAAPTLPPASRRAPGSPPTPPPRRPVVPADTLIRTHRNRNRGPSFPAPLRRYSSASSVPRRDGRSGDIPPALPR